MTFSFTTNIDILYLNSGCLLIDKEANQTKSRSEASKSSGSGSNSSSTSTGIA